MSDDSGQRYADKFYGMANGIAAFSFIQSLAYFIGVANKDFRAAVVEVYIFVIIGAVVASLMSAVGIWWAHRCCVNLLGLPENSKLSPVLHRTQLGRYGVLALMFAGTVAVTYFVSAEPACNP